MSQSLYPWQREEQVQRHKHAGKMREPPCHAKLLLAYYFR